MVDFLNLGGVQTWRLEQHDAVPLLWYQIFSGGFWSGHIEAFLLGGVALCAFSIWRWARRERVDELGLPLFLLTTGACLILLAVVVDDTALPGAVGPGWEIGARFLLAALMTVPVVVLFLHRRFSRRVYFLTFAAYGLYGLAGIGLIFNSLGQWQQSFGDWIILRFDLAAMPAWSHALENLAAHGGVAVAAETGTLGHLFTHHLIVGSLELMAAGLLLAAFLAIRSALLNADNTFALRRDDREAQVLFQVVRRGLDSTHRRQIACSRPRAACGMR